MSEVAQQRHGFCVGKLPDFSTESVNPLAEALTENAVSPVPDQVQFRIDFPGWRRTHHRRDRRLIGAMLLGHRTKDLARQFQLSEARISQLRREYKDDWEEFCGEPALSA
jgi:hypothetical protein